MVSPVPGLRCRQMSEADIDAVIALLARGFPNRNEQFWRRAFAQLSRHEPPQGLPRYGYLLENGNSPVGVLILICSTMQTADAANTRCNLSSWYVEPEFRAYAPLLVTQALRHKDVTYLNVSAAPNTWPIIEAQGFSRYCNGIFVALPMLSGLFKDSETKIFRADWQPTVDFDPVDQQILRQHAALGCISLWCATSEHAYPFVFRSRLAKGLIPCAQIIYCRDIADFARFAGPIGRYLAFRGKPLVIVDADGPIPGVAGMFRSGSMPKYFKGPRRPRLGDLAYTEHALLGL